MKASVQRKKVWLILLGLLIFSALTFVTIGVICNHSLQLAEYSIKSENLPESFQGYRIAQISDLHNQTHGKNNRKLLDILKKSDPDIIVFTGDLIDCRNTNTDTALELAKEAVKIASCYYVPGNHEARIPADYQTLVDGLNATGIRVLHNESISLENNGEYITLAGIYDPWFVNEGNSNKDKETVSTILNSILPESRQTFTLLLSHRPELFDVYADFNIDLTLSGHTHAGQIRLPLIGGLYAPNQGLLPSLDKGLYIKENSRMIVSSGVGNSLFPLRIFNPPQVVLVELKK